MISQTISSLTSMIASHPHWIGVAVFVATALESMAFVGSIFPGMSIVLVLSGVAASLGANVWGLVLWCTMGAVVGDGVSYWIGHRYGEHLKSMWPFRARPELLQKGTDFFQKNGGKSIVVGRFLPFTRAVVPVAAGMLGMNPVRFYTANILSAIGWALVNIVPAAGVGLAFTIVNQASSRVAVLLGLFIGIFFLAVLVGHVTVRFLLPRLESVISRLLAKFDHRPKRAVELGGPMTGSVPRSTVTSAVWVVLTLVLVLSFGKILEDILANEPLVRMDVALNALVQGFRSPVGDRIMTFLTLMGDMTVVIWACAALVGGLLIARAWRTAAMTVLVLVSTSVFVPLLKWTLHKPRPIDLYSGAEAFSFPSGHAAFTAVLLGLITLVGSRGLSRKTQATLWASAFTLSMLVGLSRIYLSAHWPSDVMGGLLFGWIMASLFGLFGERIGETLIRPRLIGLATITILIAAWGIHAGVSFDKNLARYKPTTQVTSLPLAAWRESGWKTIPAARIDLKGEYEEVLDFQVAVTPAAIETALKSAGWTRKPQMQWRGLTQFFGGQKDLTSLLPLPLLHNGAAPVLTMITASLVQGRRDVFRLWPTATRIDGAAVGSMLLVGSVTQEHVSHPFDGINVLRAAPAPANAVQRVVRYLRSSQILCLLRPLKVPDRAAPLMLVLPNAPSCPPEIK